MKNFAIILFLALAADAVSAQNPLPQTAVLTNRSQGVMLGCRTAWYSFKNNDFVAAGCRVGYLWKSKTGVELGLNMLSRLKEDGFVNGIGMEANAWYSPFAKAPVYLTAGLNLIVVGELEYDQRGSVASAFSLGVNGLVPLYRGLALHPAVNFQSWTQGVREELEPFFGIGLGLGLTVVLN